MEHPEPFLVVRANELGPPGCNGLCVGYERGAWRARQFADHVMEWLPEFALSAEECLTLKAANAVPFIRRAAQLVYESKKFEARGEFGELFLHIAIRQVFSSIPAISKLYYKTATNDTVKGFDAVHVVDSGKDLELWIGEAKFYDDISRAISDVIKEIAKHTRTDYLRTEFALVANKIDDKAKHAAKLRKLLDPNTSLDEVFKRVCIPVLLTYDSPVIQGNTECNAGYEEAFKVEIRKHWKTFAGKGLPTELRIHLFLIPLNHKKELVAILDERLKAWQAV